MRPSLPPHCDCAWITGNQEVIGSPVGLVPTNALVLTETINSRMDAYSSTIRLCASTSLELFKSFSIVLTWPYLQVIVHQEYALNNYVFSICDSIIFEGPVVLMAGFRLYSDWQTVRNTAFADGRYVPRCSTPSSDLSAPAAACPL